MAVSDNKGNVDIVEVDCNKSEEVKKPNNKSLIIMILLILILVALIIGFSVIFFYEMQREYIPFYDDNSSPSSTPLVNITGTALPVGDMSISVDIPKENDILNGEIKVNLIYQGNIDKLKATIYDDNNQMLGQTEVNALKSDTEQNIQIDLEVSASPSTNTGFVVVGGIVNEQEVPELNQRINIKFLSLDLANRLKIYSPLLKQVILKEDPWLIIRGEMLGFFEGVMNYRLVSVNGTVLKQDIVNANGDNYMAYVPFIEEMALDPLGPSMADTGRLEIYELSMEDGSEKILLSIALRFE